MYQFVQLSCRTNLAHVAMDSVESLEQFIDASMVYGTPSTNIVLSSVAEQIILPLK